MLCWLPMRLQSGPITTKPCASQPRDGHAWCTFSGLPLSTIWPSLHQCPPGAMPDAGCLRCRVASEDLSQKCSTLLPAA